MQRREFVQRIAGLAATWPLAARAQSERVRKIGVLMAGRKDDAAAQAQAALFRHGLDELGWTEGRNIYFDYRRNGGDAARAVSQTGLLR